jgi:hypothetical protein
VHPGVPVSGKGVPKRVKRLITGRLPVLDDSCDGNKMFERQENLFPAPGAGPSTPTIYSAVEIVTIRRSARDQRREK